MRSCASDTRISHGCSPGYLSGAHARSSSAPPLLVAISPTDDDSPPAPLSVIELNSPRSRATVSMSNIIFCVMGSPIWTACTGACSSSRSLENVAPWMPSLPMRPPTMTIASPTSARFSWVGRPALVTGITATVPQKTNGLPA